MYEYLKEFPKEAWLAFGALGGSLFTALAARLASKAQERIAIWQIEKDIKLHREKLQTEVAIVRAEKMLEKLESAHKILTEVVMAFSITGIYFTREDQPIEEFRSWYIGYCRKVESVIGVVSFYLPSNSADEIRKLYGRMNVFWGEMEGVIVAHAENKTELKQRRLEKVFFVSKEIVDISSSVASSLEYKAQEIADIWMVFG